MCKVIPFPKIHSDYTYHTEECFICHRALLSEEQIHELINLKKKEIFYVCHDCYKLSNSANMLKRAIEKEIGSSK